jgi:hypothetical protein
MVLIALFILTTLCSQAVIAASIVTSPVPCTNPIAIAADCGFTIVSQPSTQSVAGGHQTNLSIEISSVADATFQWQRKSGANFINIADGADYCGVNSSQLTVKSARKSIIGPYRCVVTVDQCSLTSNEASLFVECPCNTPEIGQPYQGGIVFRLWTENGIQHGMIVATTDQSVESSWSNIINEAVGSEAHSYTEGLTNSNAIVAQVGHTNSAAKLCLDLVSNGYDDWFLPARTQLEQMYENLAEVNSGLDRVGGTPIPLEGRYWSSTEQSHPDYVIKDHALYYEFGFPQWVNGNKNATLRVRAIRAF